MLFCLFIISSIFIPIKTISIEDSNSTTIFSTDKLPRVGPVLDFRILPYIGNGHIATVVYSDFIYMSGLYNGENAIDHVFPSTINWKFIIISKSSLYTLNVSPGIFIETHQNHEVRTERRLFASQ
ncbi:unnamed protein product [Rotaria sp. Silwood1]|nr:unnamed protein product [Rotaria sp. Silwood1]CAF1665349.1 unnamed protein product [Rotaria sp. Silwood1]